eukprot:6492505-Amphidinium_carterae.4
MSSNRNSCCVRFGYIAALNVVGSGCRRVRTSFSCSMQCLLPGQRYGRSARAVVLMVGVCSCCARTL